MSGQVRAPGAASDPRVMEIVDAIPNGAEVLDVGCVNHDADAANDPNWLHRNLHDVADTVVGIDILEDDVAELRSKGFDARVANAENFDLGQTFDVVVAGEIIEHLSNPGAFLDCARHHLRDGGMLILSTPNPWGACYLKRVLLPGEVHCNEEHTGWMDRRTLRQLVERHGFQIEEHQFVRPPIRRDGHGEYLSWAMWHIGRQQRLGALEHIAIARVEGDQ